MTTPNLEIPHVATNQAQPQIVINNALDALDNAINRSMVLAGGVSAAGTVTYTVSASDYRGNVLLRVPPTADTPAVLVPIDIERLFLLWNQDDAAVPVFLPGVPGATGTVMVPGQSAALIYSSGSALTLVAGDGGGGGGGGADLSTVVSFLEGRSWTSRLRESRLRPSTEGVILYEDTTERTNAPNGTPIRELVHPGTAATPVVLNTNIDRVTHLTLELGTGSADTQFITAFIDTSTVTADPVIVAFLQSTFGTTGNIFLWMARQTDSSIRVFVEDTNSPEVYTDGAAALRRVWGYRDFSAMERTRRGVQRINFLSGATPSALFSAAQFRSNAIFQFQDPSPPFPSTTTVVTAMTTIDLASATLFQNVMASAKLRVMTFQRYALLATHAARTAYAEHDEFVDIYPGESAWCMALPRVADGNTPSTNNDGTRNHAFVGRVVGYFDGPDVEYQINGTAVAGPVRTINFTT